MFRHINSLYLVHDGGDANHRGRARFGFAGEHGAAVVALSASGLTPPDFLHCALVLDEKVNAWPNGTMP